MRVSAGAAAPVFYCQDQGPITPVSKPGDDEHQAVSRDKAQAEVLWHRIRTPLSRPSPDVGP